MARSQKLAALALAAAVALGAAGCAAGGSASPAGPQADPATGEVISGTGYHFSVPEDWGDPGPVEGFDPDSIAADLDDADGFSDNVNVILSPAGKVTPEQVETAGVKELEDAGATDVTVQPRVAVGGSESAHLSAALASSGAEYVVEQYYVSDSDQTYVVTFSFSPTVSEADRAAVTDPILASWEFED